MTKPQNRPYHKNAFTLVEVLLALLLTTLLVSLTGQIAVQTLTTCHEAERIALGLERELLLRETLKKDIESILVGLPGDEAPVMLFGEPRQVLQLSVLTASPVSIGALHQTLLPATVRYRLRAEGGKETDLIREVVDRTKASAVPVRETIATGLSEFRVEVLGSRGWMGKFPSREEPQQTAKAVRISCRWADGSMNTVQTIALR